MMQTRKKRQRIPVNKVTTGFRVSDELRAVLEPVLPMHINTHRFGRGNPRTPDHQCADAIFYVLRTGCQWSALDATELCPHSTAPDRFQQWVQAGVFCSCGRLGWNNVMNCKD
jgi:putative transposase